MSLRKTLKSALLQVLATAVRDDGGKIVFYHDIHTRRKYVNASTPVDVFRRHLETAARLGFSHVDGFPVDERTFHVCLDDGYRGILDCMDVLQRYHIKPTIYLPIAHIDKEGYLTRSEVLGLQKEGFDFQSHTWNHVWLTEIDPSQWRHEFLDARVELSNVLGRDVTDLCFPRGLFSKRVCDEARTYGYSNLISCLPGSIGEKLVCGVLPRNIVQDADETGFSCILKGALKPLRGHYQSRHYHSI